MSDIKVLGKSAQSVQNALSNRGLVCKVIQLDEGTRTAQEAAKTIGCEVAQIMKSLIFRTKEAKKPILVLASGINRVNEKMLEQYVGEAIERADADFVRAVTGFAIGGIPPIGHQQIIETFIDEDLFQYQQLWAAAGTPNTVFCLNSSDIKTLTDGKVIAIK